MSARSEIVAVILTKNEEINVERCMESLQFCKEVIVLDSGSTDRTEEIARSLGARFYTHVQPPPFRIAEQRNWVLDNHPFAGEWVLFIDADCIVQPNAPSLFGQDCDVLIHNDAPYLHSLDWLRSERRDVCDAIGMQYDDANLCLNSGVVYTRKSASTIWKRLPASRQRLWCECQSTTQV